MAPHPLAATLREIEEHEHDPQDVLTALVQLHSQLCSSSGLALSLPSGSPVLSRAVELLQRILQRSTAQSQEEIVWFIARVAGVWGRGCSRFQLEAGRVRLWKTLQLARAAFPKSLRVLETSLDATAGMLLSLEYHQQLITTSDTELVEELLELLGRFTRETPNTTIVVLSMKTLASLYSSPRVVETFGDQYTRRVVVMLHPILPYFLKTPEATCVWLALGRQLVKLKPGLTLPLLFGTTDATSTPSWSCELLIHWKHQPTVVYDLCALLTQLFLPVPHVLSPPVDPDLASALVRTHALVEQLTDRFRDFAIALDAQPKLSDRERRQLQATLMEIIRVFRQWSFVPEVLAQFPSVPAVKKALIPLLASQVERYQTDLSRRGGSDAVQWRCQLLLELVLTLQRLMRCPELTRAIGGCVGLRESVALLLKQRGYAVLPRERDAAVDAGDGDLPAVLERELRKTLTLLSDAASAKSSSALSSSQRGLRRVPSSSSRLLSTGTSSALTIRRTPSSSSQLRTS